MQHTFSVKNGTERLSCGLSPLTACSPTAGSGYSSVMAVLMVMRGAAAGSEIALDEPCVTIGRDRSCDVVCDDTTVSRAHAELRRDGDDYTLMDTGSLNGTYLNRHPVAEVVDLTDGDEIWIGTARFRFHVPAA